MNVTMETIDIHTQLQRTDQPEIYSSITALSSDNDKVQYLIQGPQLHLIRFLFSVKSILLMMYLLKNPYRVYKARKKINHLRKLYLGSYNKNKIVRSGNRYYFNLHTPGFPSLAMREYALGEINRIYPVKPDKLNFKTVIFGITKCCPLRCKHCYEWKALGGKEVLTTKQLIQIVSLLQKNGAAQIQISGGEPMTRYDDVLEILHNVSPVSEFIMLTSGYLFTHGKAKELKEAGLAGITVALDHFVPWENNNIKGNKYATQWAMEAIRNANSAGLMVSLSLCAGKDFVNEQNMKGYMEMAKDLNVAFVHILEPRAVGNSKTSEIELSPEQELILEHLFLKMNFDRRYRDMPVVVYHGYHQRKNGCFGGGNRYLYIDTDGDVHACPFCRGKAGNILNDDVGLIAEKLRRKGCGKFQSYWS